jgi:flagellar hook-associated protein 3 FlgL
MATSISTLGQSLSQTSLLKKQQITLYDLQNQLSTGKKTQKFSGLGSDVIVSKRARAEAKALETYTNNIKIGERRIERMTIAIEEFKKQAGNVANIVAGELQEGEISLETINDLTTNILPFLENLINEQESERYLFSGAATSTQPLNLTNSGTFETYLQNQLLNWRGDPTVPGSSTIATTTLISNYRDANDSIIGYNASLSGGDPGRVTVRADYAVEVDYSTLGNESAFRDVIVAVSMMKELTTTDSTSPYYIDKIKLEPEDYAAITTAVANPLDELPVTPPPTESSNIFSSGFLSNPPTEDELNSDAFRDRLAEENQLRADGFFNVLNDLGKMLNNALDDLDNVRFNLESDRVRLDQIKQQHELDSNTLLSAISDAEDADMNEVALSLNFLQIQLEASYRVTASLSSLNLMNFL